MDGSKLGIDNLPVGYIYTSPAGVNFEKLTECIRKILFLEIASVVDLPGDKTLEEKVRREERGASSKPRRWAPHTDALCRRK